jgi:hypothetical protein
MYAQADEKAAAAAESIAKSLLDALGNTAAAADPQLLVRFTAESVAAETARKAAAKSATTATLRAGEFVLAAQEFQTLEDFRRAAYGLTLGDKIENRLRDAKIGGAFAVLIVASGIACLALAPKQKSAAAATSPAEPSLVQLTLTKAGAKAAGCVIPPNKKSVVVRALRTGGTDKTPTVITFSSPNCPLSRALAFRTAKPPFGAITPVGLKK